MRYGLKVLAAGVIFFWLVGCNVQAGRDASATAQATSTITPSPTPILPTTIPDTSTPLLPTPDFLDSPVANGFLLSSSDDPDCQLPCWQGLHIGESGPEDIQAVFDTVFGFEGTIDFFDYDEGVNNSASHETLLIPGMRAAGYVWSVRSYASYVGYEVHVMIDEQTDLLQGVRFMYQTGIVVGERNETVVPGYFRLHTPQEVIGTLGAPDNIIVQIAGGSVVLFLIYNEGVVSQSTTIIPLEERTVGGEARLVLGEFCLDAQSSSVTDFIIAPFGSLDPDSMTPLQRGWIAHDIAVIPYATSPQQAFGLTVEDISRLALETDHPCIDVGS